MLHLQGNLKVRKFGEENPALNVLCPRKTLVYAPEGVHLKAAGKEMVAQELARVLAEKMK